MSQYKCKSPVLFITFTKENETKQVFEIIKQIKPDRLYIASDGARIEKQGEKEKIEKLRNWLVSNVDWDCELKTKFNDKNLGCGHGPASAISWFFENEEMGIIIEDDILASFSFFQFCDEILEKYKDDNRIGNICGYNSVDKKLVSNDYYFSKYSRIWGWASWRRAWSDYDFTISSWEKLKYTDFVYQAFPNKYISKVRYDIYDKTYNSRGEYFNAWDYQWSFCNFVKNRLTVVPCCNLVSNIGFTKDAIHTFNILSSHNKLKRGEIIFPLNHPVTLLHDDRRDRKLLKSSTPNLFIAYIKTMLKMIINIVRRNTMLIFSIIIS